jgi:hypothetical protein
MISLTTLSVHHIEALDCDVRYFYVLIVDTNTVKMLFKFPQYEIGNKLRNCVSHVNFFFSAGQSEYHVVGEKIARIIP